MSQLIETLALAGLGCVAVVEDKSVTVVSENGHLCYYLPSGMSGRDFQKFKVHYTERLLELKQQAKDEYKSHQSEN